MICYSRPHARVRLVLAAGPLLPHDSVHTRTRTPWLLTAASVRSRRRQTRHAASPVVKWCATPHNCPNAPNSALGRQCRRQCHGRSARRSSLPEIARLLLPEVRRRPQACLQRLPRHQSSGTTPTRLRTTRTSLGAAYILPCDRPAMPPAGTWNCNRPPDLIA